MVINRQPLSGLGILGLAVLLAVVPTGGFCSEKVTVVHTPTAGRITGRTLDGVREFRNIKYAQDPVGELRFQPPVRLSRAAEEEVDATSDDLVSCVQGIRFLPSEAVGVEECLVLSVRVPEKTSEEEKLPIVFWIHGGGLTIGHGEQPGFHFDRLTTAKMGVMSVNINYRLAFLGWAATAGISPNNGLRDMITALQWVRDNGAAFGGDPDNVTVVGESGGGTAVLALLRSPLATGLFNRAVSLSPAPVLETKENVEKSQSSLWLPQIGCDPEPGDTDAQVLECLHAADASDFSPMFSADFDWFGNGYFDFPLRHGPDTLESGCLVFEDGEVVASSTLKSSAKVILSNLIDEVAILQPYNGELEASWDKAAEVLDELLPTVANTSIDAEDLINGPYLDMEEEPAGIWSRVVSDIRSTCPINALEEESSGSADITRVLITHHLVTEGAEGRISYPATHGYDTYALFGFHPRSFWNAILTAPSDIERGFQDAMIELVMRENGGSSGHVMLGRTEDGGVKRKEMAGAPREAVCEWLESNGIGSQYSSKN